MSQRKRPRNKPKRKGPPTLAGIVRNKTNHGKVIVDFYLDVVTGKLDDEGFEACHRLEAAEQLHAIAPGLVAEYLELLTGTDCTHAIVRKRTSELDCRAREERAPLSAHDTPGARREALEYLASALAAPSLADDPRVADIVHVSTDHGRTVVSFLLHVMHGAVRGFRPRNRVQAACELLGHIARDELARSGALTPISAKAGIQNDVDADRSRPAESNTVRPEPVEGQFSAKATIPETNDAGDMDEPGHRGIYDIHHRMTRAQWNPDHPIHKFIQAYDEVAETFLREDDENDNNERVRLWISGELPDIYGKYISDYAPADPKYHRVLKPKRRRRRSTPKAESIWGEPMLADTMREQGDYPPKRTLIWI